MKKAVFFLTIILMALAVIITFIYVTGRKGNKKRAQQQMQTPPVTVSKPVIRDVNNFYEFTGYTEAIESVKIRARVKGFLETIEFEDSSDVNKGEVLFTIEPYTYRARVQEAEAQLKSSMAEFQRAETDLKRVRKAAETNAVSQQEVTKMKAQRDKAEAAIMAAEAALSQAKLDLSYTKIESPISGRVGRNLVDAGNLVGAGKYTMLTTVVKLQPIYVYFDVGEDILTEFFMNNRPNGNDKGKHKVLAKLPQEKGYHHKGYLDYIANEVDPSTGTIRLRGVIDNDNKKLLPGMFVQIKVPAGISKDAVLVKEIAVNSDIGGKFVYVLDENNVPRRSFVELGRQMGELRVIKSGIKKDETYVVKGFHMIRPNQPVQPIAEGSQKGKPKMQDRK